MDLGDGLGLTMTESGVGEALGNLSASLCILSGPGDEIVLLGFGSRVLYWAGIGDLDRELFREWVLDLLGPLGLFTLLLLE